MGASAVGFAFARFVARDWVAARLPKRLRAYDERLARSGLRTVIVLRLVFFLLPASHWLLGLSQVRFGEYMLGTLVGALPGIVLMTYLGGGLVAWLLEQPPPVWIGVAVVVGAVIVWRRVRGADSVAKTPDA
jgi:uncharacterized membrane protein YdjX (TVP38/TMEM64 family)